MFRDERYPGNAGAIARVCSGMNGILEMQEQFAGYVQDVRYNAVAGMPRSVYVQDVRYNAVPRMAMSVYVQILICFAI